MSEDAVFDHGERMFNRVSAQSPSYSVHDKNLLSRNLLAMETSYDEGLI